MSHPDQTPHSDDPTNAAPTGNPYGTPATNPYGSDPYTSPATGQYPAGSYPAGSPYATGQYATGQFGSDQHSPLGQQPAQAPKSGGVGGFFRALFDTSFTRFVTPSLVRILYILSMIGIGLYWIVSVIVLFAESRGSDYYGTHTNGAAMTLAVLDLLFGWILAVITLAFVRMQFEFVMALIRTSEYARDIKSHLTGSERPNH